MSIDKYSNTHTIEVLNDSEDLFLKTNAGTIYLNAVGADEDADVRINTGDSFIARAEDKIIMEGQDKVVIGAGLQVTGSEGGVGDVLLLANDDILLLANNDVSIDADGIVKIKADDRVLIYAGGLGNALPADAGDVWINAADDVDINASDQIRLAADDRVIISANKEVGGYTGTSINESDIVLVAADDVHLKADDKIYIDSANGVFVDGGLVVDGGLACDTFTVDGESVLNNTIDWSDVHPSTSIKLRTDHYDGLTLLAAKHLSVVSSAGSGEGVYCEVGGWTTQIKGKSVHIGYNYGTADTSYNNDWKAAHGGGNHCTGVSIGAKTSIYSEQESGHVLTVGNMASTANNNGIKIHLNSDGGTQNLPTHQARWLEFRWNKSTDQNPGAEILTGLIRGAEDGGGGNEEVIMSYTAGTTPTYYFAARATDPNGVHDDGNLAQWTAAGNAQFVSGSADFGEFFEVGDTSEWPETWGSRELKKVPGGGTNLVGLQEGMVVWVRENKFYRNMEGDNRIPMFITKRSIVTGDGALILSGEGLGEVLSFCGKLPIIIKGVASPGDYIVPEDNENYCYAISNSDITFAQYKKAMGRALSGCEEKAILSEDHPFAPEQETEFSVILCAVGIK